MFSIHYRHVDKILGILRNAYYFLQHSVNSSKVLFCLMAGDKLAYIHREAFPNREAVTSKYLKFLQKMC